MGASGLEAMRRVLARPRAGVAAAGEAEDRVRPLRGHGYPMANFRGLVLGCIDAKFCK